jgi:hypothetical protein
VDVVHLVFVQDALDEHVQPGRHAGHNSNVPFRRLFHHHVEAGFPIGLAGDAGIRLLQGPHEEGDVLDVDPAHVAFEMVAEVLQGGRPGKGEDAALQGQTAQVEFAQGEELADAGCLGGADHLLGDRDVLGRGSGSPGAEGKIFDLARPGDICLALFGAFPPGMHAVVVAERHRLLESLGGLIGLQDPVEAVVPAKCRVRRPLHQLEEYPLLAQLRVLAKPADTSGKRDPATQRLREETYFGLSGVSSFGRHK